MRKIICLFVLLVNLVFTGLAQNQKVSYSGIVFDEDNEPLPGVTIKVANTKQGTITDLEGKFTIKVLKGTTIQLSYIGYKSKIVKLNNNLSIKVQMESNSELMDEVVVTGYGSQKRSDISTAVASVNMNDANRTGSSGALEALQGQISGVQITSDDGSPSGGMTFHIRGTNSFTGGTQPLFVIDGVPQAIDMNRDSNDEDGGTNPLSFLNMDDIESMEILKDAAASSIYGAEGSNGVVLITTKQGSKGKPKVNVVARCGINFCPSTPMKVLSPEEYARRQYLMQPQNASWRYIVENEKWNDPNFATNWDNCITRDAMRTDLSASIQGGGESNTYMLSLGYQNNEGLIQNNSFERLSVRLNLNQKIGKKVTLAGTFSYANTVEKNPQQDGLYLKTLTTNPFLGHVVATDEELLGDDSEDYRNPMLNITDAKTKKGTDDINGSLKLTYQLFKDLKFNTSFAAAKRIYDYYQMMGPKTQKGRNSNGIITLKNEKGFNWVYVAQLQYDKTIAKDNRLSAFVAYEIRANKNDYQTVIGKNFENMNLGEYSISQALDIMAPTYTYSDYHTLSLLGRASYSYKMKYIINTTLRRDGSSKFGVNNKYALFPSLSLAWRMDQEKFMKNFTNISSLKIRASYGVTGNNQIPSYQSLALLKFDKVGMGSNSVESSASLNGIGNTDLKWETSKEYNFGFDLSLFKDRLSITADYYQKRISNMLVQAKLPQTSGFTTLWKNSGELENKGLEFTINARPIQTKDFSWNTNFNITFNKNNVISLNGDQYEQLYSSPQFTNNVLLRVGNPTGIYYGYIADGVYNTQEELDNSAADPNKALGRTRIVDTNHDGVIDDGDRVPIANVNPVHFGGWGNTFLYKGFEFYAFLRWSYGNDQINANLVSLGGVGNWNGNCLKELWQQSWSREEQWKNYTNHYETNNPYKDMMTSNIVDDGSFLRLSSVRLGYDISAKFLRRYKLSKLKLSVTGNNLLLFTNYRGFDPEASTGSGTAKKVASSFDSSSYPRPISVLFSVELGF